MIAGHWPQLIKGHTQLDRDLGSKGQAAYRGVSSGRGFALLESQAPPYFAWPSTYAAYAQGYCCRGGGSPSEGPGYLRNLGSRAQHWYAKKQLPRAAEVLKIGPTPLGTYRTVSAQPW